MNQKLLNEWKLFIDEMPNQTLLELYKGLHDKDLSGNDRNTYIFTLNAWRDRGLID